LNDILDGKAMVGACAVYRHQYYVAGGCHCGLLGSGVIILSNPRRGTMARSQEIKKDEKKKSQKTLKEKRLEKKAKKESKK
jgi:hypothetical protein